MLRTISLMSPQHSLRDWWQYKHLSRSLSIVPITPSRMEPSSQKGEFIEKIFINLICMCYKIYEIVILLHVSFRLQVVRFIDRFAPLLLAFRRKCMWIPSLINPNGLLIEGVWAASKTRSRDWSILQPYPNFYMKYENINAYWEFWFIHKNTINIDTVLTFLSQPKQTQYGTWFA